MVAGGSRLLVNVANDGWFRGRGGEGQHLQQVVFRAIETGLPLLRATRTGITVVIGPDGSVLQRLSDEPGVLVASVDVPSSSDTLYARVGDLFALGCLLLSAAAATAGTFAAAGGRLPRLRASPATRPASSQVEG